MRPLYIVPFAIALVLQSLGCGTSVPSEPFTVRDSAGIQIVESRAPATLAPLEVGEPLLSLGGPGDELNQVVGALLLTNGSIVVADGGNQVIHLFSAEGLREKSLGGAGDGPSEFRVLQAIGVAGDDMFWAYDFSHHRVSFFGPDLAVELHHVVDPPVFDAGSEEIVEHPVRGRRSNG